MTPATAQVSVDDEAIDISQPIELPYGIHKVYMEADGYYPLQKHVQVGSEYANISFTMEPKEEESSISENSTGDDWDQSQQKTYDPSQDEEVPFKQSVSENTADKQSVSANSTNANNKVYVDIKGGQEGVEVYLDGYYIGNAPVKFKKVTGSHTISLRKEGYHTRSYTIYLYNDGDDITYSCEPLVKKEAENTDKPSNSTSSDSTGVSDNSTSTGSTSSDSTSTGSTSQDTTSTGKVKISVEGDQEGVEIYLDKVLMGMAPVEFEKTSGSHEISAQKEGYETQSIVADFENSEGDYVHVFSKLEEKIPVSGNDSGTSEGNQEGE